MAYRLEIHPSVLEEVQEILDYLDDEKSSLGNRFLKELDACFESILAHPFGYQLRKGSFRHAPLSRMRYRVVYRVHGKTVRVVQVRHTSRRPSRKFGP